MGRWLLILGGVVMGLGLVIISAGRFPLVGRLPGDILVQRHGFAFYFPMATRLVLSVVLTIVLNLALRLWGR